MIMEFWFQGKCFTAAKNYLSPHEVSTLIQMRKKMILDEFAQTEGQVAVTIWFE